MAFGKFSFTTFSKFGDKSRVTNSTLSSVITSNLAKQIFSSDALIVEHNRATFPVVALVKQCKIYR